MTNSKPRADKTKSVFLQFGGISRTVHTLRCSSKNIKGGKGRLSKLSYSPTHSTQEWKGTLHISVYAVIIAVAVNNLFLMRRDRVSVSATEGTA